jgi:hypothetical protein
MSTAQSLRQRLIDNLAARVSADTQLTKTLPKMAQANVRALQQALQTHLKETEAYLARLKETLAAFGEATAAAATAAAGVNGHAQPPSDEGLLVKSAEWVGEKLGVAANVAARLPQTVTKAAASLPETVSRAAGSLGVGASAKNGSAKNDSAKNGSGRSARPKTAAATAKAAPSESATPKAATLKTATPTAATLKIVKGKSASAKAARGAASTRPATKPVGSQGAAASRTRGAARHR